MAVRKVPAVREVEPHDGIAGPEYRRIRCLISLRARVRLYVGIFGAEELFRAVAGLWSWGGGRIGLPESEEVMFLPQRPYMLQGAFRDTLSYPSPANSFSDEDLVATCECVGLGRLTSDLDRHANWDNELTNDEAQRVAFARLLLHKPRWVCVDRALDALSEPDRRKIVGMFDTELAGVAVVSFGDTDLCSGFSTRTLHLVTESDTVA